MTARLDALSGPVVLCTALALLASCDSGEDAVGLAPTPAGGGPVVRFDLFHRPLPEVPLPNDLAARPDPGSRTGMRLNASMVADTGAEADIRMMLDRLDGWGTFSGISVAFDCPDDPDGLCLDLDNVIARHQGDDFSFPNDAIYVIDIDPGSAGYGTPVPLDIGEGYFPVTLDRTDFYFEGDPRADSRNLIYEDRDEDLNGNGRMDPGEDSNHDGILGMANVWPPAPDGVDPTTGEWAADGHLVSWYELGTNTLIMRPVVPLRPGTRYAVILTSRLVDEVGRPVRSPFPYIAHLDQTGDLAGLGSILSSNPGMFGGLGIGDVGFAWSFTTQTLSEDLRSIREGLNGRGRLSDLADEFPPELIQDKMQGCNPFGPDPHDCELPSEVYIVNADQLVDIFLEVGEDIFPIEGIDLTATIDSYRTYVDYIALGHFWSPNFLDNDGNGEEEGHWDVDGAAGRAPHGRLRVSYMMVVPKQEFKMAGMEDEPFPVLFHTNGTGSTRLEGLGHSGQFAKFGIATVSMDAVHHGIGQTDVLRRTIEAVFQVEDLAGAGKAIIDDRSRDLNGDGTYDSGGDFWTSYIFDTKDNIRQTAVDWMQFVKVFRSFDGTRRAGPVDVDGDGSPDERWDLDQDGEEELLGDYDSDGLVDLAGDLDGDGHVDIGGPDVPYYAWGQSLGGIVTTVTAAHEPWIDAAAPVSVGGGLSDVGIRSTQDGVPESVILRTIGPLAVAVPATDYIDVEHPTRSNTVCEAGEISLRFIVTDIGNLIGDIEFACLGPTEAAPGNVLVVENLANGVRRCAPLDGLVPVRTNFPADLMDPLEVTVLEASGMPVEDFGGCVPAEGAETIRTIGAWEAEASFQYWDWAVGDDLVSPAEGFGQTRSNPSLRRFLGISQVGLDDGDPVNSGPRYRYDPFDFPEEAESRTNILITLTTGDMNVPINTGLSLARAVGVLDVFGTDPRWGMSQGEALQKGHVIEGNEYRNFWIRESDGASVLFDASDLDRGADLQDMPSFPSEFGEPAFRLWVPTIPGTESGCTQTLDASGLYLDTARCDSGVSGLVIASIAATGTHSFLMSEPDRAFDINLFLVNMIGYYLSTGGKTISLETCLEDSSCPYTP